MISSIGKTHVKLGDKSFLEEAIRDNEGILRMENDNEMYCTLCMTKFSAEHKHVISRHLQNEMHERIFETYQTIKTQHPDLSEEKCKMAAREKPFGIFAAKGNHLKY